MSNPNGCPFVHSQPVPNFAIRCPYCDYVTPPAEPGTFITLNAARAEARPAVDREAVARWRNDAFQKSAEIVRRYFGEDADDCVHDILALLSPATSPGEGSSGADRAARIASDHAASETPVSAGRRLHDCWQAALSPHTATGERVQWDDFDAEQQAIWDDAARLFLAAHPPRPGTGAQAAIRDGLIEISISIDALPVIVSGSCCCNALDGLWKVTDPAVFAKEVCHALNNEREDGTTPVHVMFDKAFMHAIEQGAEGIEEATEEEFEAEAARLAPQPPSRDDAGGGG